jgi:hypothetical protein
MKFDSYLDSAEPNMQQRLADPRIDRYAFEEKFKPQLRQATRALRDR